MAGDSPKYMYFKLQFKNDIQKLTVPINASHRIFWRQPVHYTNCRIESTNYCMKMMLVVLLIHSDTKLSNKMTLRIKKGKLIS